MAKRSKENTVTENTTKMFQIAVLKSLLSRNVINQPTYDKAVFELMKLKEAV